MQTYDIDASGHSIQLSYGLLSGREVVVCDGRTIADQRSFRGVSVHPFVVEEEGGPANLSVTNGGQLGYVVRKNSEVVAQKRRPLMGFLTALITLLVSIGLLEVVMALLISAGAESLVPIDEFVSSWAVVLALVGSLPGGWWLMSFDKRARPQPSS